jgi:dTDP-4-dehydrorhamnose 3,5-epimerase-like enzyme
MITKTRLPRLKAALKACLFIILASMTFGAYAYVGNPTRPDTIWVPAHCAHGCWVEGHYLKILTCVNNANLVWVDGGYDMNGNWIAAHWQLNNYVVVNPGRDSYYPGWAM